MTLETKNTETDANRNANIKVLIGHKCMLQKTLITQCNNILTKEKNSKEGFTWKRATRRARKVTGRAKNYTEHHTKIKS